MVIKRLYKARPILENYVDVIEASKILDVHPETVKRLIREGKLNATKFGNKWIMEFDQLRMFATTYDRRSGRVRRLLCVMSIAVVDAFLQCDRAIRRGLLVHRTSRADKEFHFQDWFQEHPDELRVLYERTSGQELLPSLSLGQ